MLQPKLGHYKKWVLEQSQDTRQKKQFFNMNSETFGSQGQASHDSQDEPPLWECRDSLRFWMFKKRFKGSNQLQIKSYSTCQKDLNENYETPQLVLKSYDEEVT
jgi:hypothetical protein